MNLHRNVVAAPLSLCLLVVMMGVISGCAGNQADISSGATQQIHGHVIEVIARSITEVETLRIRDSAGTIWTFTTRGFVGFSPSHLREHQLFGESIEVRYTKENGILIALDITD